MRVESGSNNYYYGGPRHSAEPPRRWLSWASHGERGGDNGQKQDTAEHVKTSRDSSLRLFTPFSYVMEILLVSVAHYINR